MIWMNLETKDRYLEVDLTISIFEINTQDDWQLKGDMFYVL